MSGSHSVPQGTSLARYCLMDTQLPPFESQLMSFYASLCLKNALVKRALNESANMEGCVGRGCSFRSLKSHRCEELNTLDLI